MALEGNSCLMPLWNKMHIGIRVFRVLLCRAASFGRPGMCGGNSFSVTFCRDFALVRSSLTGRVGSGRVGSGQVGSGRIGSGQVGSGRVGSVRVRSPTRSVIFQEPSDPTRPDPWGFESFLSRPVARLMARQQSCFFPS